MGHSVGPHGRGMEVAHGLPQILCEQHAPQLSAEALLPSSSFRPQQVSVPETTRREESRVSSSLGRGAAMYFRYTNIYIFFSTKVMVWVNTAILRWVLRFLHKGPFLEAVLQHHLVGPRKPRAAKEPRAACCQWPQHCQQRGWEHAALCKQSPVPGTPALSKGSRR